MSADFLFKWETLTSHILLFMLFDSTLSRISFEILFLNLYLGALFYKKNEIKNIYL